MSDRKVVRKMVLSLDGHVTSPDGAREWMFQWFGEDSTEQTLRELDTAGLHAVGRRSYETMGRYRAAPQGPTRNPRAGLGAKAMNHAMNHGRQRVV